jgi:hypothetical protein
VFRVPYTPGLDLAKRVRGVLEQEARKIRIQVKVVEGGGMPLRRRVVNTDLARGKPFPQGNCPLCLTGKGHGDYTITGEVLFIRGTLICARRKKQRQGIGESWVCGKPR